jgi:hypothetical protein
MVNGCDRDELAAHASGEWIASDQPVCAVTETATASYGYGTELCPALLPCSRSSASPARTPRDAPDLLTPSRKVPGFATRPGPRFRAAQWRAAQGGSSRKDGRTCRQGWLKFRCGRVEASAALCDRLVAELNALQGGEDAALWAFRSLLDKKPAHGSRCPAPRGGLPSRLCRTQ